jgi:GGDEF domain-containing protein
MTNESFFEDGSRLLTQNAFDFVLDSELKRAVRSQNFLTLLVLEARREWEGIEMTADDGTIEEVAQLIGREVRDTDLLGKTGKGTVSIALLDADYDSATRVVERLLSRIDSYGFPKPVRISMGAACYPTHAVDAAVLKRQAVSRPVVSWRGGPSMPKSSSSGH